MKRSEVNERDIWRIEDIFQNVGEWEKEFSEVNKALPSVLSYKGKLGDKYEFLDCMECNSAICRRLERLCCYAQ